MALLPCTICLLSFLTICDTAPHALWILAILLAIINIGAVAQSKPRQRAILAASAIILSWIVITVWCSTALNVTSLIEALIVIGGFALLAIGGGVFIARGDVVLIIAGGVSTTPLFGSLLASHLIIGIAMLAVAWLMEQHDIAILAVALLALGTALSRTGTPAQQLVFAGAVYAIFIAYPLLLGTRAKRFMQPYLAAVLAGIPFFVFARRAIENAGYGYAIGFLPVFQAALMLLLVWRLLRIEAEGERLLSRLALTAAAALAFITIAIPLQLEKPRITIGWALEGAALVRLSRRLPSRGLLASPGSLPRASVIR